MAELGMVGDRCHRLLQHRCPQMGAGDREGSGAVAWEGLKLLARAKTVFLWVRGRQRPRAWESLWSHTGRRVPTGDGVSCARKWAEADWGCGFPHG